jgi:hypothetical protein
MQVGDELQANNNRVQITDRYGKGNEGTPVLLFLLFSYLYFVQGCVIGIAGTMPYIYKELPDVHTMALFHAVTLPYSLKFLLGTSALSQPPSCRSTAVSTTASARPG